MESQAVIKFFPDELLKIFHGVGSRVIVETDHNLPAFLFLRKFDLDHSYIRSKSGRRGKKQGVAGYKKGD